jgi:hypothetical protein
VIFHNHLKKLRVKICVSIRHAAGKDLCAAVCVNFTRMRVIENKNRHACVWIEKQMDKKQKQKAKHGVDACSSKVYVYYDEWKVIF